MFVSPIFTNLLHCHFAIGAFAVAVGTDFALILAALHLGVLGTLGLDRHIAAVILADEVLERHVHAAGVALEFAAVKIVADGNEAGMEQWMARRGSLLSGNVLHRS